MANEKIAGVLKKLGITYLELKVEVDASLATFSKDDEMLNSFLFKMPQGYEFRSSLTAHLNDASMIGNKPYDKFHSVELRFDSITEAEQFREMLMAEKLTDYLRKEFYLSFSIEAKHKNIEVTFEL